MPKQNEKILVADPDPEVLDLVAQQVLGPQGYQVSTALDGSTALKLALRLSPDIVITSLDLPGLSGRDLMTALRSQGFESVVIATGSKGSELAAMQAFRLGAKDYLTKPLRETELIAALDRALEELRLRREREQLSQKLSQANLQLEKRVKELTTLYGIGKAVTAITDLGQLLGRLVEGALFVSEAEVGWLLLSEEGTAKLVLKAGKNLPPPNLSGIKIGQVWDDGLSSLLMLSGEGLTIGGEPLAKMRAGQVVKSACAAPIKAKDQVMGVITVGNKSGKPFTDRDQAMLSAVADYASVALVNARLFEALEERARSLQKAYDDVMRGGQQRDALLQKLSRDLSGPLQKIRDSLEILARGAAGHVTQTQMELLRTGLEQVEAMRKQLPENAPPPKA
jgi:two-component system, NtrC family, sensor kinase